MNRAVKPVQVKKTQKPKSKNDIPATKRNTAGKAVAQVPEDFSNVGQEIESVKNTTVSGKKSPIQNLIQDLKNYAGSKGFNQKKWALAAQMPEQSLSRILRSGRCDLASLGRLAKVVGLELRLGKAKSKKENLNKSI